jgi:hypothetical protein
VALDEGGKGVLLDLHGEVVEDDGNDQDGGVLRGEQGAGFVAGEGVGGAEDVFDVGEAVVGILGEEGAAVGVEDGAEVVAGGVDGGAEGGVSGEEGVEVGGELEIEAGHCVGTPFGGGRCGPFSWEYNSLGARGVVAG